MREYTHTNEILKEADNNATLKRMLSGFVKKWKWFVLSIILCVIIANIYLHYAQRVYNVNATALIRETEPKTGQSMAAMSANLPGALFTNPANSISDEIEIMRSTSVVKNAIIDIGAYVTYRTKEGISTRDLYDESPVIIKMEEKDLNKIKSPLSLEIKQNDNSRMEVETDIQGEKTKNILTSLPAMIQTSAGSVIIGLRPNVPPVPSGVILAEINPPTVLANSYLENLTISKKENTISVVNINFKTTHKKRGEDFVNAFIKMYNQTANNDKNMIAQKTADFINERIGIIGSGLGSTETALENTKRSAGLTNMTDLQSVVADNVDVEKQRVLINTQLQLTQYLKEYVNSSQNNGQVIPANIGIENGTLTTLISRYNEQLLSRNRYLESSTAENPIVIRKTEELKTLKENILASINNVHQSLLISKRDMDAQAGKLAGKISRAPTHERVLTDISRQQEIKSSLYLMLLQKREENNITLASTADNARVIDPATVNEVPITPNNSMVRLLAIIIGIILPILIIMLSNFFKSKIETYEEVESLTKLPIIGNVPAKEKAEDSEIGVQGNNNVAMSEAFREIRTNLRFILNQNRDKVILVTSTLLEEGKTFVASNLALSLASLGKKVLLIGMDIRNPQLANVFGLDKDTPGLTELLLSNDVNYEHLLCSTVHSENLSILQAGAIPPNPTELLELPVLRKIIENAKQEFDYIVLDSAPVGVLVDAIVISDVADATLYVCRVNHTKKEDFLLVNKLNNQHKLPKIAIIINGLDVKKEYSYTYNYGKKRKKKKLWNAFFNSIGNK